MKHQVLAAQHQRGEGVSLLDAGQLPVEDLALLALREGQRTNPLFRCHRWFARRLSTQFRALLVAAASEQTSDFWQGFYGNIRRPEWTVLDPFVGGATGILEACQIDARVVGVDIDPVAATISRFELIAHQAEGVQDVIAPIQADLEPALRPFYTTQLKDGSQVPVLYYFWVQVQQCPTCDTQFEVHPHYCLARDPKRGLKWVFCSQCHEVRQLSANQVRWKCRDCHRWNREDNHTISKGTITCPVCKHAEPLKERAKREGRPPSFRLFAIEALRETGGRVPERIYQRATSFDQERYNQACQALRQLEHDYAGLVPQRPIPSENRFDARPVLHGFTKYRELHNDRQLLHLGLLNRRLRTLTDSPEAQAVRIAFSDHLTSNSLLTSYAVGYRRSSPMFSIHAYRHVVRPVEVNPWIRGPGRGTFPQTISKMQRAVAFARAPTRLSSSGGVRKATGIIGVPAEKISTSLADAGKTEIRAILACQDSRDLAGIPDGSVDLVLTDPPYADNVAYSELSDFYLAWHQVLGLAPPGHCGATSAPTEASLVSRGRTSNALEPFEQGLTEVLRECHRVLKPDGRFVFTFHHVDARVWSALGNALKNAKIRIHQVFPMRGEGSGGLHTFKGTIKWDAVLVGLKAEIPALQNLPTHDLSHWSQRLQNAGVAFNQADLDNLSQALALVG